MKKILHADDVGRFRDLVKIEFETDFLVTSLPDCDTVLDEVEAQKPDVVILDHLMPSGNDDTGFEVCQQLRAKYPSLPIVVFTGAWEGTSDGDNVEETWGTTVVSKSRGTEALRDAVEQLLTSG